MTDLFGVTVVVTRPAHQADVLCQSIKALGGVALRFPVIEIRPCNDIDGLTNQLRHLDSFQLAIFVSANAVSAAMQILGDSRGWPTGLPVAAVGQATARAIAANGLTANYTAPEPYNSEALLDLPVMKDLKGERVIILRGEGGLELLGNTLRARGAEVEYAECYRRVKPETDTSTLYQIWDEGCTMPIVVTSNEGLQNLYAMMDSAHRADLLASPLIVVSHRAVALAKDLGFNKEPLVAKSASNDAILSAIKQWKVE